MLHLMKQKKQKNKSKNINIESLVWFTIAFWWRIMWIYWDLHNNKRVVDAQVDSFEFSRLQL